MHCGIGTLLKNICSITGKPARISEKLNEHFKSVYTLALGYLQGNKPTLLFTNADMNRKAVIIDCININNEDLIRAIYEMNSNSTNGPDGFPVILSKSSKRVLARSLLPLFQSFLANGKFQSKLNEAGIGI